MSVFSDVPHPVGSRVITTTIDVAIRIRAIFFDDFRTSNHIRVDFGVRKKTDKKVGAYGIIGRTKRSLRQRGICGGEARFTGQRYQSGNRRI